MNILKTIELTRSFGGIGAVRDVNITVEQGDIVGLVGPNGAGKTTLFNLISGFYRPTKGKVLFKNEDITDLPPHKRAKLGLARTFQDNRFFPNLTVKKNVEVGCFTHVTKDIGTDLVGMAEERREEVKRKVSEILESLGLTPFRHNLARELSFGFKSRLGLAIALGSDPELLLLDEPLEGTYSRELPVLARVICDLNSQGKTIILIEHQMESVANLCNRLIYLDYGSKVIPYE